MCVIYQCPRSPVTFKASIQTQDSRVQALICAIAERGWAIDIIGAGNCPIDLLMLQYENKAKLKALLSEGRES